MGSMQLAGEAQGADEAFPEGMSAREQNVIKAIARLDRCVGLLEPHQANLGDDLYGELISQAHSYAVLLTSCREMRMSLKDARVREAVEEIEYFCAYLEEEFGG